MGPSGRLPLRPSRTERRHCRCFAALLTLIAVVLLPGRALAQCGNNNTFIGGASITPACPGTTEVPCVRGGQYALVNVEVGNQYVFSVCGASFDTQLTLYNNAGGGALGYNDDFCGTASQITWNASFTGQLRVLVDRYNCGSNTTCAPLTITCGPTPPAAREDCLGAVTICDDASFSGNTDNTGSVTDLNSSNRGCLDPERQGTWYVFAPSQAGTLGFSVNVGGSSVYDWAIWGPFQAGTDLSTICPPSSPPIRCEASSNGGTFASTGSYTKGMGHASFSTPQYAPPTTCSTCSNPPSAAGSCNTLTAPRHCGWVPGLNVQVGEMYLMYIDNWYQTGLAFTLDWSTDPGAASLACTILPVELFNLRAEVHRREVHVKWSSIEPRDLAYHEVQRSSDGHTFETIGQVAAGSQSMQRVDHEFIDPDPFHGAGHYRLRSVALDGTVTVSDRVTAYVHATALGALELHPVPASDHVQVTFTLPEDDTVTWLLLDASGRLVRSGAQQARSGRDRSDIPLNNVEPGTYFLHLLRSNGTPLGAARFLVL